MQVSTYSRLATGQFLRVEYLPLNELRSHPTLARLHLAWLIAGGPECDQDFLAEVMCVPGGWVARLKPNPADIVIVETDGPNRLARTAWGNDLEDKVLMMDMLLCRELKEPIFQHLFSASHFNYFQVLLPGKERIYGLRQPVVAETGRVDARHAVEA